MKLIHTADLHLGAQSTTHFQNTVARRRRLELLGTFAAIAELAVREGAAAVLIAGDLFDTARPSAETVNYVIGTVKKTPDVRFFCLPGNHDGGTFPDVPLPENLVVFGTEWSAIRSVTSIFTASRPWGRSPTRPSRPIRTEKTWCSCTALSKRAARAGRGRWSFPALRGGASITWPLATTTAIPPPPWMSAASTPMRAHPRGAALTRRETAAFLSSTPTTSRGRPFSARSGHGGSRSWRPTLRALWPSPTLRTPSAVPWLPSPRRASCVWS
ncbi:MAG: metallophosphoesterase [Clostridia bacterium]|nr:metallophosphoesterase [Clostridia bacterium]